MLGILPGVPPAVAPIAVLSVFGSSTIGCLRETGLAGPKKSYLVLAQTCRLVWTSVAVTAALGLPDQPILTCIAIFGALLSQACIHILYEQTNVRSMTQKLRDFLDANIDRVVATNFVGVVVMMVLLPVLIPLLFGNDDSSTIESDQGTDAPATSTGLTSTSAGSTSSTAATQEPTTQQLPTSSLVEMPTTTTPATATSTPTTTTPATRPTTTAPTTVPTSPTSAATPLTTTTQPTVETEVCDGRDLLTASRLFSYLQTSEDFTGQVCRVFVSASDETRLLATIEATGGEVGHGNSGADFERRLPVTELAQTAVVSATIEPSLVSEHGRWWAGFRIGTREPGAASTPGTDQHYIIENASTDPDDVEATILALDGRLIAEAEQDGAVYRHYVKEQETQDQYFAVRQEFRSGGSVTLASILETWLADGLANTVEIESLRVSIETYGNIGGTIRMTDPELQIE